MTYPSGTWRGFWEQTHCGRQEMRAFELHFDRAGVVTGHGIDMVGPFTFAGQADLVSGAVTLTKQYLGKHQVHYDGQPDGEGCIYGKWTMDIRTAAYHFEDAGNFLMKPDLPPPTGDEPIVRMGRKE